MVGKAVNIDGLYRLHRRRLFFQIQRIVGCQCVSEELVQEAFIRIMTASRKEDIEYKEAFLSRTARNLAIDYVRKQKAMNKHNEVTDALFDIDSVPSNSPGPEQVFSGKERMAEFMKTLDELPKRVQQVFLLKRVSGLSYPQIAQTLGLSESTIYTDFHAGMRHFVERQGNS